MFYSHEILTSRKYGVATIWLVATLGAKSTVKKVSRKAILDVDIRHACESIITPDAPLALRLQSNLLYGVSRVYSQQCGYVLADAQSAQTHLKTMLKAPGGGLDADAGKARREQLVLMDDPAFIPEIGIPPPDFNLETILHNASQATPSTMLSVDSHLKSTPSNRGYALGLNIPSSVSYHLPIVTPFNPVKSSSLQTPILRPTYEEDAELEGVIDNIDFEFDADGNIIDISDKNPQLLPVPPNLRTGRVETSSAASSRVRQEHEIAQALRSAHQKLQIDDDELPLLEEDELDLVPIDESFTLHDHSHTAENAARRHQLDIVSSSSNVARAANSEHVDGAVNLSKNKKSKAIQFDVRMEIPKADLKDWQLEYLDNMAKQSLIKHRSHLARLAKKNASSWVFGNGLADVGKGIGANSYFKSPLDMFAGDELHVLLLGQPISPKRRREGGEEEIVRRVKPRTSSDSERELEIALNRVEDDLPPLLDDDVEIGRDARPLLEAHHSSTMPWNVSSSALSHRALESSAYRLGFTNLPSSSLGGVASSTQRLPPYKRHRSSSRIEEPSPLLGRGRYPDLPDIERLDLNSDIDNLHPENAGHSGRLSTPSLEQLAEFDMFGPAAQVDTQTAQLSQWLREALDRESYNFLQYASNSILEAQLSDETDMEIEGDGAKHSVSFETLFPPRSNHCGVAAQAFLHVLTLATKNLLVVTQDKGGRRLATMIPHGEISISLKDGVLDAHTTESVTYSDDDIEMQE